MLELNKIHSMDCVKGMKMLPDECIDLTVTSPPYDNLRTYNGFTWDFEATAKELYRVTKEGGVVVWVVADATIKGSETGTSFKQALFFKECGFNLHDTMIYQKQNYVPLTHNRYEQEFEYMFVFSKGKPKVFNPIKIPCKYAGTETWGNVTFHKTNSSGLVNCGKKKVNDFKQHGNIFCYLTGKVKSSTGAKHPAPFPEQLAADHIVTWSNEGDVILDPFIGSGTTAKMALLNNRHFIGFDISQEYCEIAKNRIDNITKGMVGADNG
jgi:site-specific DNA-methyltransferase (adenine-specific)